MLMLPWYVLAMDPGTIARGCSRCLPLNHDWWCRHRQRWQKHQRTAHSEGWMVSDIDDHGAVLESWATWCHYYGPADGDPGSQNASIWLNTPVKYIETFVMSLLLNKFLKIAVVVGIFIIEMLLQRMQPTECLCLLQASVLQGNTWVLAGPYGTPHSSVNLLYTPDVSSHETAVSLWR